MRVGEFLSDPKNHGDVWPDRNDFVPASSVPEGELVPQDVWVPVTRHTT